MNVLITGSSSGLGHALVREFIDEADNPFVLGLTKDAAEGDDAELEWDARQLDELSMNNVMMEIRGRTARMTNTHHTQVKFNVVVHCAGINDIRHFEEVSSHFLQTTMQVNAFAPVMLTQSMHNDGLLAKGCVIVVVTSDAAWRPMRHSLAYNMSKAAADMAVKQMARELSKPFGYSIFAVRPGKMFGTNMSRFIDKRVQQLRGWTAEEAKAYAAQGSVTGVETPAYEVAKHIYRLITGGMAPYLSGTGQDLAG